RTEHLDAAISLWRGRPFPDLDRVDALAPAVQAVQRDLVDAALALGELRLVSGEPDVAVTLAERVLGEDPYDDPAHRLAIAAQPPRRDSTGIQLAVDRLHAAHAELGIEADERTRMLLRQVDARVAPAPQ